MVENATAISEWQSPLQSRPIREGSEARKPKTREEAGIKKGHIG